MKLFSNKNLKNKIVITVLICLMCSFVMPNVSSASGIGDYAIDAVQKLFLVVGDAGMYIVHLFFDPDNKDVVKDGKKNELDIPNFTVTPEEIFQNKIDALDINFFSPNSKDSIAAQLQKYVSGGYTALRYLAIVALLSVLVYLGIQIMMGSTGQKKADFKEKLKGWFLAMCLLFAMHYLMVFSIFVIEQVTKSFSLNSSAASINIKGVEGNYNAMEYTRIMAQKGSDKEQFGFIAIYLVMVAYTFIFVGKYLKRVVYMAFLTIIAPLVAATYPLEKSKSFNRWFKEYITQLMIQPINMLIYFILIVKATELVKTNIIYTIISIAFINTADSLVRNIFNLAKADEGKGAFGKGLISGAVAGKFLDGLGASKGGSNSKPGSQQQKQPKIADNRPNTAGPGSDDMYSAFGGDNVAAGVAAATGGAGAGMGAALAAGALGGTSGTGENEGEEKGGVPKVEKPGENEANVEGQQSNTMNEGIGAQVNENNEEGNIEGAAGATIGAGIAGVAVGAGIAGATQGEASNGGVISADIPSSDLSVRNGISGPISELPNGSHRLRRSLSKGANTIRRGVANVGREAVSAGRVGIAGAKVVGKAGIRMAAGTAGAVAVGAAAAIATGDVGVGLKGMKAGYRVGSKVDELPSNAYRKVQEAKNKASDAVNKEYYKKDPETYKQYKKDIQVKRSDEAFMKDKDIQQKYKEEFGMKQYEDKMQEAMEYRKHGITDNDLITKAMKTKGFSQQEQVNLARMSSSINSRKDLERIERDLTKRNVDKKKIENISKTLRKWKGYN